MSVQGLKSLVARQPVGAMINAPDCMRAYSKGVFTDTPKCTCSEDFLGQPVVNHGVTIIGYGGLPGQTKGCSGYWIVTNSWGPLWGEAGFIRLCISDKVNDNRLGICNIQSMPIVADVGIPSI